MNASDSELTGLPPLQSTKKASGSMPPALSIVSTAYRSEPFLAEFINQIRAAIKDIRIEHFEIIIVNDGSPDDSLRTLLKLKSTIPQLVVVNFTRNFGHHYAIHAGLKISQGELVFLIDSDLETSPSVLKRFYETLNKGEADAVYGFQVSRKGGNARKHLGALFWRVFNYLSDIPIPANTLTERLMRRSFVEDLITLGDRNLFIAGMMHWTSSRQIGIEIERSVREGESSYSFRKRTDLLINAITSFSSRPLRLLFKAGLATVLLSILFSAYLVVRKLLYPETVVAGWTSLATLIVFSSGISTTCLGLVGIYLGKIYNQVQNRPLYVIRDIYR